ncbi:endonuclease domain-containing protein [Agrococcus baldri]|uniref:Restriction endonuclease type II-like domain-containing protein n=1 Tax=Agrococcus baldri TaxID=153730 RepID=A0AA87RAD1_9MICO|nr:DUF559 domain-containing protein [Agrococcus baldri]GEK79459.1 hypothetical protein ABA31_08100 [Agrococcus baldri]
MQLRDDLPAAHVGVLSRSQILTAGGTDREIRLAVAAGTIRRLRAGWYAWPTAEPDVVRAIAAGGVVSCVTALAVLGVWVPADGRVHLRRSRRLRGPGVAAGLSACDLSHRRSARTTSAVDGVLDALAAAAGCLASDMLTVVIDSVLHLGLATRDELEQLWAHAPRAVRRALDAADGTAESGTETLVRLRLLRLGLSVEPQVWIGRKRVDFLLGERLIIEVDSRAWHLDAQAYERDRERDRQLAALGYHVIRLTYSQVLDDWASVEADILAIVSRGDHLRDAAVAA